MDENKYKKGFVRFPGYLFEKILISDFNKLELKTLFLIIKLSIGCLNTHFCYVQQNYFISCGIAEARIKEALNNLTTKNVINCRKSKKTILILLNKDINSWAVKTVGDPEKLGIIIGENIRKKKKKTSQNNNFNITQTERNNITKTKDQVPKYNLTLANNYSPKETFKDKYKDNYRHSKNDSFECIDKIIDRRL